MRRSADRVVGIDGPTVALYLALRDAGITKTQLARRLGVNEKEVRRMLNPRHPTKLPWIEQEFAVLGRCLVVLLETEAA